MVYCHECGENCGNAKYCHNCGTLLKALHDNGRGGALGQPALSASTLGKPTSSKTTQPQLLPRASKTEQTNSIEKKGEESSRDAAIGPKSPASAKAARALYAAQPTRRVVIRRTHTSSEAISTGTTSHAKQSAAQKNVSPTQNNKHVRSPGGLATNASLAGNILEGEDKGMDPRPSAVSATSPGTKYKKIRLSPEPAKSAAATTLNTAQPIQEHPEPRVRFNADSLSQDQVQSVTLGQTATPRVRLRQSLASPANGSSRTVRVVSSCIAGNVPFRMVKQSPVTMPAAYRMIARHGDGAMPVPSSAKLVKASTLSSRKGTAVRFADSHELRMAAPIGSRSRISRSSRPSVFDRISNATAQQ